MASTAQRHSPSGQNHDRISVSPLSDMAAGHEDGRDGPELDNITLSQKMVSAMSGSLLTSVLVTPLDVVRVRLQSQKIPTSTVDFTKLALTQNALTAAESSSLGVTACCREVFFAGNAPVDYCIATPKADTTLASKVAPPADCAVEEVQRKTYNSTYDGLRKIARNEGVTTLWRGLSPTLLMTIPANIIYFTGYDWLRHNPASVFSTMSDEWAPLTAGSFARTLAAAAVNPIELVRTRMQAATGRSTSNLMVETFKGVREMIDIHGYGSLWRGLTLTLWRDVPFSGLYWWGYETIRGRLTDMREQQRGRSLSFDGARSSARRRSQSREKHVDTFVDSFAAGATSGAFAAIVTTPFDVGKTRKQVYKDAPAAGGNGAAAAALRAPEEQNMVRLLWHIFKTEGVPGLWKGWIPRTLKVAPACAIMISSYEVSKRVFRGVNERNLEGGRGGGEGEEGV